MVLGMNSKYCIPPPSAGCQDVPANEMRISLRVGSAVLLGPILSSPLPQGNDSRSAWRDGTEDEFGGKKGAQLQIFVRHGTTELLAVRKSWMGDPRSEPASTFATAHYEPARRMVGLRAQARRQVHIASYPWSSFFVREGSVKMDVAESTIPKSMNVDSSYIYNGFLVAAQRRPSRCELDALPIPVAADLIEVGAVFAARCLFSSYADVEVPRARAIHLCEPLEAPQQHASALSLGRLDERLLDRRPRHDGIGPFLIQSAAHTFGTV
ncbi:hypothetical protein EDD85DRAFT_940798 [Armillaria nabsnona]|nr:hypothetical protein EDD85DRAFT_940798 [Armillaria nabsnona]